MKPSAILSFCAVLALVGCTPSMTDRDYRPELATIQGASGVPPADPDAVLGTWCDIWTWNDNDFDSYLQFNADGSGSLIEHAIFNLSLRTVKGSQERTFRWRWVDPTTVKLEVSQVKKVVDMRVRPEPYETTLSFYQERLHDHGQKRTYARTTDTIAINAKIAAARNRVEMHDILRSAGLALAKTASSSANPSPAGLIAQANTSLTAVDGGHPARDSADWINPDGSVDRANLVYVITVASQGGTVLPGNEFVPLGTKIGYAVMASGRTRSGIVTSITRYFDGFAPPIGRSTHTKSGRQATLTWEVQTAEVSLNAKIEFHFTNETSGEFTGVTSEIAAGTAARSSQRGPFQLLGR